jgi:hypothetical protein
VLLLLLLLLLLLQLLLLLLLLLLDVSRIVLIVAEVVLAKWKLPELSVMFFVFD